MFLSQSIIIIITIFFLWRCDPTRIMAFSFLRFLDHTQRRTTAGRTPLDKWSARRRDLYLTTHNTHNRQTSMPPVGFEPTISAGQRPQTYALDRAATGIGIIINYTCTKKVKVTLVQALRLCTGPRAHRGSRGTYSPTLDHGTRRGWGVSFTPRPLFTPGKDPVPIVQEAGWAPGPVWTGTENIASTGIRSPDRPARSQSLYWLSYPAH